MTNKTEFPAHDLLAEALRLPTGYKATIYDKKGEANWDNRVVVTYADLLAEFTQIKAERDMLKQALKQIHKEVTGHFGVNRGDADSRHAAIDNIKIITQHALSQLNKIPCDTCGKPVTERYADKSFCSEECYQLNKEGA